MTETSVSSSAADIAQAVQSKKISALDAAEAALKRIATHNPVLNDLTDVTRIARAPKPKRSMPQSRPATASARSPAYRLR